MEQIKYDRFGRMLYNPEFHPNQGKPWNKEDLEYLINWYDIIGPTEMSLAIGRTYGSIEHEVSKLRRRGIMKFHRKKVAS